MPNRPSSTAATPGKSAHLIRVLAYEQPRAIGMCHATAELRTIEIGRAATHEVARRGEALVIGVADPRMSKRHARFVREGELERDGGGRWIVEDLGSRNGTFVDGAQVEREQLVDGMMIELGRTAWLWRDLDRDPQRPADLAGDSLASPLADLRTFSPTFARALADVARVARTRQNIVVHGETGTGKEIVARGIHAASERTGAFVAVNCAALPDTLVESELFGVRKGAFSGATDDRVGFVRAADRGTLFFDEIGDLPLSAQGALLRVLQEREVTPVGATAAIAVDLRVVCASHRDLSREVAEGRFREDLLARLSGYAIDLPPVRARREDLGILVASLLERLAPTSAAVPGRAGVHFSLDAGAAIVRYPWPRNVRELEQALGSALAVAEADTIGLEHLPPALRAPVEAPPALDLAPSELAHRDQVREVLARHHGNIAAVGRELGVARMQVHRWIKRYRIDLGELRVT